MLKSSREWVHGWGYYPTRESSVVKPSSREDLSAYLKDNPQKSMIPRGSGLAYGDSSIADCVIDMTLHHKILSFDETLGVIHVHSGVTLNQILKQTVLMGWFLPVTPGVKNITVGGAIASDVHGKNHHVAGCFSAYVTELHIMLRSGETKKVLPTDPLFKVVCGGMGLSGVILDAKIQLSKVPSSYLATKHKGYSSFGELFSAFENSDEPYQVAWFDLSGNKVTFKKGILSLGEFSENGGYKVHLPPKISLKFFFVRGLINRLTISLFNFVYYYKSLWLSKQSQHYDSFFYPLDGLGDWYKVHGKDGFLQTQMVLPLENCLEGYSRVFECISQSKQRPVLSVFKKHGEENGNFLSFPMKGYSLAMDFSHTNSSRKLIHDMAKIVHSLGGRYYMTKDAILSEKDLLKNYTDHQKFAEYQDSLNSFQSSQSKRWKTS